MLKLTNNRIHSNFKTHIFCVFFLLFAKSQFAQLDQKLYYIISEDGTEYGLVNDKGDTLLPISVFLMDDITSGTEYLKRVIEVRGYSTPEIERFNQVSIAKNKPTIIYSAVFHRNMELLYYPFWFDNGSDYFVENRRRYVDIQTGKMGFVNSNHEIIIPAAWDFVSPFEYGYAIAYNHYEKYYIDNYKEHWDIRPIDSSSSMIVIDRFGNIPKASQLSLNDDDIYIELLQQYYEAPFKELDTRHPVIENIPDKALLEQLFLLTEAMANEPDPQKVTFAIIDTPAENYPFYHIQGFYDNQVPMFYHLRYDLRNKEYYFSENAEDWRLLARYIYEQLLQIQQFRNQYPAALSFDLDFYLEKYKQ